MYKYLINDHDYHIMAGLYKFHAMNLGNYLVDDTVTHRVTIFGEKTEYDFGDNKTEFYYYSGVKVEYATFIEIQKQVVTSSCQVKPVRLIFYYDHKIDMHAHINGLDYTVSLKYRFDSDQGYQAAVNPKIEKAIRHFVDLCLKFEEDYKQYICTHSYRPTKDVWVEI